MRVEAADATRPGGTSLAMLVAPCSAVKLLHGEILTGNVAATAGRSGENLTHPMRRCMGTRSTFSSHISANSTKMARVDPKPPAPPPEAPVPPGTLGSTLADLLGETDGLVRTGLATMVKRLGEALCAEVLRETEEIEAGGGLWLIEGRRRRTKGGVFLTLMKARRGQPRKHALRIHSQGHKSSRPGGSPEGNVPFPWEQRGELVREALLHKGQAMIAKLTLMGRPGKVVERRDFVVTAMEQKTTPSLPKGLPDVPNARTTYTVYIAVKQWRNVAGPLKDHEDQLIVEGVCVPDTESGGIAVLAQSVTTKALQKQKRSSAGAAPPHAAGRGPSEEQAAVAAPAPAPAPSPPAPPSAEVQVRLLLKQSIEGGKSVQVIAERAGLSPQRVQGFLDGQATSLTPAQVQTFVQRLKRALTG